MLKKVIGSILMIVGTAVGAGMLALPVATAEANYQTTVLMMLFAWIIMTIGALAILEVNLWFPSGANFFTMVQNTYGKYAKIFSTCIYLLLLYSLLCAYLSGIGDILHGLLASIHLNLPRSMSTIIALVLLSAIVIRGISTVDVVNRGLMGVKFLAYVVLVFAIAPHISLSHLTEGKYVYQTSTLMVIVTSFGFANIIPTLRAYLHSDKRKLIQVVVGGSLLALVIYLIWVSSVQGLLTRTGDSGLLAIFHSSEPNTLLMKTISALVHSEIVSIFAKVFISICAVTSFLGVAISLVDFIADGLQTEKKGMDGVKIHALAFLPPFIVVLLAPGIFIKALGYAGFFCVFLLILLPVAMLYRGRYLKAFTRNDIVPGGKIVLIITGIIAVALLVLQIVDMLSQ
jgi:tyrosine-specific transport protein